MKKLHLYFWVFFLHNHRLLGHLQVVSHHLCSTLKPCRARDGYVMGHVYLSLNERAYPCRKAGTSPFLTKKEAHSPENAKGNSYKSRGWIPKNLGLPCITGEGFLIKRAEALH